MGNVQKISLSKGSPARGSGFSEVRPVRKQRAAARPALSGRSKSGARLSPSEAAERDYGAALLVQCCSERHKPALARYLMAAIKRDGRLKDKACQRFGINTTQGRLILKNPYGVWADD